MDGLRVLLGDVADLVAVGLGIYLLVSVWRLQDRVAALERQALRHSRALWPTLPDDAPERRA